MELRAIINHLISQCEQEIKKTKEELDRQFEQEKSEIRRRYCSKIESVKSIGFRE